MDIKVAQILIKLTNGVGVSNWTPVSIDAYKSFDLPRRVELMMAEGIQFFDEAGEKISTMEAVQALR